MLTLFHAPQSRSGRLVRLLEELGVDYQIAYVGIRRDDAIDAIARHRLSTVYMPGDKITTTCTYSSPARFGKATSDEMCYFFSIHWPAGALSRQSLGSIIHGPNTCID